MDKIVKLKLFEVSTQLEYLSEKQIIKALENNGKDCIKDYAYILHNKDNTEPHWHILIRMDNAYTFDYIANRFGVPVNFVNSVNYRWANALLYLTHGTKKAIEEGVELLTLNAPVRIHEDENGNVCGFVCQPQIISVYDKQGKPSATKANKPEWEVRHRTYGDWSGHCFCSIRRIRCSSSS